MEFVVILLIGLVVFLIGAPVMAMIRIGRLSEQNDSLRRRLSELEDRLVMLEKREPATPVSPRTEAPKPAPPAGVAVAAPAPVFTPPPKPVAPPVVSPASPPFLAQSAIRPVAAPEPVLIRRAPIVEPSIVKSEIPSESKTPKPAFNWERFVGVNLLMYVAGFAIFLFVAFGLKYSFDHDWISSTLRTVFGYALGTGLVVGGLWLSRRDYAVIAQTLCATGVVCLYAVTYAGRSVYHFEVFSPGFTFGILGLITVGAFVLAVRQNAMVVAILGMLGGFLTPILVSTGQNNPGALFGYIALLDIGLFAVVLNRRWHFLMVMAATGTVLMELGWSARFFTVAQMPTAHWVFLGFCGLFLGGFQAARFKNQQNEWFSAAALIPAFSALAFAFYLISEPVCRAMPGPVFAFVFGADVCVLILVLLEKKLFPVQVVFGMVVFLALEFWISGRMDNEHIYWGLGLALAYAVLHSGFPLLFRRLHPDSAPSWWANLFPLLALALVLTPACLIPNVTFMIWPCILLIDGIAVLLAILTRSMLAILAALVMTLVITSAWVLQLTPETVDLPMVLLVIGGGAFFFFGLGLFASEKVLASLLNDPKGKRISGMEPGPEFIREIPALGALLPFLLLVMVVARMPVSNPSWVFGLAAVFCLMLLGLGVRLLTGWLSCAALCGVLLLEHAWHFRYSIQEGSDIALGWYGGFYLLFAAVPFVFWKRLADKSSTWVAAGLAGPLHYYMIHDWIKLHHPTDFMGLIPGAFAFVSLIGLAMAAKRNKVFDSKNAPVAWCGGVALFFITLIFPVQYKHEWITVGWVLEGTALLWLFNRVPHPGLRATGIGLLAAAFIRLSLNPAVLEYHMRTGVPIFNWYLYVYLTATACLLAGARLLAPPRDQCFGLRLPPVLNAMGLILLFLLVNIEIADSFGSTPSLTFEFSGNLKRDMTYTIAWSVFAFGLLVLGVWKSTRALRYCSWALLGVSIAKLFLHDLDSLGQLYRLGALISVAVMAMLASFVYQRFLNRNRTGAADPAKNDGDKIVE